MTQLQIRLTPETCEIIGLLFETLGTKEKVYFWLTTKNLNLGDISPLYIINVGRAHRVLEFIKNAREVA